jgi:YfiR/HmsC-like
MVCNLFLGSPPTRAQEEPPIQYRTEANFLAHFPSFVDWPDSAFPDRAAPIHLCLFGAVNFGSTLSELTKDMMPQGRHIEIRSVKTPNQARSCHILFIGRDNAKNYGAILGPIRDLPILTVGETENFLDAGGIISFAFDETLQIDINAGASNRARLRIRTGLATLARRVINKDLVPLPSP